jgi:fatty-acyl-CoA synthase
MPSEKWGESPCAFVEIKSGSDISEVDLVEWCKEHMASFKVPRKFVFEEIPKTSTGKVQKYILRERFK